MKSSVTTGMMHWHTEFKELLPQACVFDASLAGMTSWGIGGPAECLLIPGTKKELQDIYRVIQRWGIPLWILGGGTNILVPDKGLPGVTLCTRNMREISLKGSGSDQKKQITCQTGLDMKALLKFCLDHNLQGLEFTAGIPGTLGGAVIGNAGASGQGIGYFVQWVEILTPDGTFQIWHRDQLHFCYRRSNVKKLGSLIFRCGLNLKSTDRQSIAETIRQYMQRRTKQPRNVHSAGCVFKNPDDLPAGKLLDISGCKGLRCGAIRVSSDHANFFINDGGGTASQVITLIRICQEKVFRNTGITLDLEVTLLGESWK